MKYNWDFLLNIGFEQWHIEWLKKQKRKDQDYLYTRGYTPLAIEHIGVLSEMGFHRHTLLGLWVRYPKAFNIDTDLFRQRTDELIQKFGIAPIDEFFWKYNEFCPWEYMGLSEKEWKGELNAQREAFRAERRIKMERLIAIGFPKEDVEDLEEICPEFQLDVLAEYYLEPRYLRTLKCLLEAGFSKILLQLFVDDPERFTMETPVSVIQKRASQIGDVWEEYRQNGNAFLDALLDEEDERWEEHICKSL